MFIWEWDGGAERALSHSAQPDTGLNLTTLSSWPELKLRVGRLTDCTPQMPLKEDIDKLDNIKMKNLGSSKDNIKKEKRQALN